MLYHSLGNCTVLVGGDTMLMKERCSDDAQTLLDWPWLCRMGLRYLLVAGQHSQSLSRLLRAV